MIYECVSCLWLQRREYLFPLSRGDKGCVIFLSIKENSHTPAPSQEGKGLPSVDINKLFNHYLQVQFFLNTIPYNFQLSGGLLYKTHFQPQKTFEIKLISIRFSVAQKSLFPLFREFIVGKSTFISFPRHFIALKTVVVPIRRRSPFK